MWPNIKFQYHQTGRLLNQSHKLLQENMSEKEIKGVTHCHRTNIYLTILVVTLQKLKVWVPINIKLLPIKSTIKCQFHHETRFTITNIQKLCRWLQQMTTAYLYQFKNPFYGKPKHIRTRLSKCNIPIYFKLEAISVVLQLVYLLVDLFPTNRWPGTINLKHIRKCTPSDLIGFQTK